MSQVIKELREKIAKVDADIQRMRTCGDAERAINALADWKDYLQDELRMHEENELRSRKSINK